MSTLLGSAPTLEGITQVVRKFYEPGVTLVERGEEWRVVTTSGKVLESTRIRLHKGRYRFEMVK